MSIGRQSFCMMYKNREVSVYLLSSWFNMSLLDYRLMELAYPILVRLWQYLPS